MIYTIFVFLLHKIAWISYMIGVYMKWNPKQQPSMYYDTHTQNGCHNSDMIILFPSTKTSHQDGTVAYEKGKRKSDIINKQNINPSKEFTLFYIWLLCQILKKYGNSKIWPWNFIAKVTGKVSGQGHTWNKWTYFMLLLFRANLTMHSKDIDNLSFDLEVLRSRSVPNSRNFISWFSGHVDGNRGKNIQ